MPESKGSVPTVTKSVSAPAAKTALVSVGIQVSTQTDDPPSQQLSGEESNMAPGTQAYTSNSSHSNSDPGFPSPSEQLQKQRQEDLQSLMQQNMESSYETCACGPDESSPILKQQKQSKPDRPTSIGIYSPLSPPDQPIQCAQYETWIVDLWSHYAANQIPRQVIEDFASQMSRFRFEEQQQMALMARDYDILEAYANSSLFKHLFIAHQNSSFRAIFLYPEWKKQLLHPDGPMYNDAFGQEMLRANLLANKILPFNGLTGNLKELYTTIMHEYTCFQSSQGSQSYPMTALRTPSSFPASINRREEVYSDTGILSSPGQRTPQITTARPQHSDEQNAQSSAEHQRFTSTPLIRTGARRVSVELLPAVKNDSAVKRETSAPTTPVNQPLSANNTSRQNVPGILDITRLNSQDRQLVTQGPVRRNMHNPSGILTAQIRGCFSELYSNAWMTDMDSFSYRHNHQNPLLPRGKMNQFIHHDLMLLDFLFFDLQPEQEGTITTLAKTVKQFPNFVSGNQQENANLLLKIKQSIGNHPSFLILFHAMLAAAQLTHRYRSVHK